MRSTILVLDARTALENQAWTTVVAEIVSCFFDTVPLFTLINFLGCVAGVGDTLLFFLIPLLRRGALETVAMSVFVISGWTDTLLCFHIPLLRRGALHTLAISVFVLSGWTDTLLCFLIPHFGRGALHTLAISVFVLSG